MSSDKEENVANSSAVKHVLILGGGSAGLMTAHLLKRQIPRLKVTVVRSESLPPIGVGESTTPVVAEFVEKWAVFDRMDFFQKVRPTWKLGIKFDWVPEDEQEFYYPFDVGVLQEVEGLRGTVGLHHQADRRVETPFTEMMDQNKAPMIALPGGQYQTPSGFAYHLENRAFVSFLEEQARVRGIDLLDRKVVATKRMENGDIECVVDENGDELHADLFVDATGFRSQLLGGELDEPFDKYERSLFCDRAVTGTWERSKGVLPYTGANTMKHGWCWRVELQERVNRGYVFSSNFCDVDSAVEEMRRRNPEMADEDVRVLEFTPGRRRRCWVNNVFAVGNSAGFMEPLEATGLHMICLGARLLTQSLQYSVQQPTEKTREVVNSALGEIWDDIKDCLALHYKFNRREQTPFWKTCREETDLGSAEGLVEYYRENGASPFREHLISRHSIFNLDGYYAMMIGLGVPSSFDLRREKAEERSWQATKKRTFAHTQSALGNDEAMDLIYRGGLLSRNQG